MCDTLCHGLSSISIQALYTFVHLPLQCWMTALSTSSWQLASLVCLLIPFCCKLKYWAICLLILTAMILLCSLSAVRLVSLPLCLYFVGSGLTFLQYITPRWSPSISNRFQCAAKFWQMSGAGAVQLSILKSFSWMFAPVMIVGSW